MTIASFISSGTSHAILNGLLFFAFVLWLCLGFWTYKDAKRRMEDPLDRLPHQRRADHQ